jgi:chromosome segregation ATPase
VNIEVEKRIKEVEHENEKYKSEYSKLASLRAAYNADKSAFADKVADLEARLRHYEMQKQEL